MSKTQTKLTDDSPMPFGIHKGKRMEEVPADYLLFIYNNDKCTWPVAKYVRDNLDVLEMQSKQAQKDRGWRE